MRLTTLLSMAARVVVPKDYRYGTNRPWTQAAKRLNPPGKKRRKVFVEPIAPEEWSVLKGDTVSRLLSPWPLNKVHYLHPYGFPSLSVVAVKSRKTLVQRHIYILEYGLN